MVSVVHTYMQKSVINKAVFLHEEVRHCRAETHHPNPDDYDYAEFTVEHIAKRCLVADKQKSGKEEIKSILKHTHTHTRTKTKQNSFINLRIVLSSFL